LIKPNQTGSAISDRKDGFIALGLGLLSFALYARTLVPELLPGDGGEFQTLAYTLGHAHTTGYEVYTVLARLFTLLVPLGDIAYRVNLFSAFCASLTIAFVYLSAKVLSHSRLAGAISAFLLAIATTFWSQAIIAEVYTPGSAVTSAILWLVLVWYETGSQRHLFAAGILGGLGIGVHGSNSLFAPAILILILLKWKDLGKAWKPALGGAVVGLLVFLAAFAFVDAQPTLSSTVRAVYRPSISRWDMQPADLNTFGGRFMYLVFAKQWRSAMFVDSNEVFSRNQLAFGEFFGNDFPWIFQILLWLGLVVLLARRWRLGVFFMAAILVQTYYTLNYSIGDIYVFYISLYVYLVTLVAEGVAVFLRLLNRLPGILPKILQPALVVLLLYLAAAPVYAQRLDALQAGNLRFDFMDLAPNSQLKQRHGIISYNVKALDKNAIILMDWGELYGYFYAAEVEQGRTDLLFIEAYPYSYKQGMADSLFSFLKDQIQQGHPVYALQRYDELQRGGFRLSMKSVGLSQMYEIKVR
jgi:hypothetical protein